MNTPTVPPPAYSTSDPQAGPENGPPAFEPGPSAPVLVNEKISLIHPKDDNNTLSPSQGARASVKEVLPTPPFFEIGGQNVSGFGLVTSNEICAHLSLLGAFARLKASVKSQKGPDVRRSADELWAIYLARAVDRFAKWAERGIYYSRGEVRKMREEEVPPLDVLMAWHAYMLNPRVYYEDGIREKSRLSNIPAFPIRLVNLILDSNTLLPLNPSPERRNQFELATGEPWVAPLRTTLSDTTMVPCPRCEEKTMTEVCWVTDENTGFAQHGFKARCHVCMGVFDRHAMMVRGFCDDVIKARDGLQGKVGAPDLLIAGTLLDWRTGELDIVKAVRNNQVLLKEFLSPALIKFNRGDWLAGSFNYSIEQVETALRRGLVARGGQQQCITRYCAWLNIMSKFTKGMLVPTLVSDLVWHTHQLKHEAYRAQTLSLFGRFPDHDDKIEENKLSDAYDQTAKYWEEQYGVPYHVCGCIHPPFQKSNGAIATISKFFKGKSKGSSEFVNTHPELIPTDDYDATVTHPSEHNGILITGQSLTENRQVLRAKQHAKWDKQIRASLEKGKVPPNGWEATSVRRAEEHNQSFTRPFPDPNLMPVVPFGAETCATYDGRVLQGNKLAQLPADGMFSAGVCAAGMGYYGSMGACGGGGGSACGGGGCGGGGCGGGGCGGGGS
ncbi:dammaradiene synthase [Ceratobasidium sp. AG-Ba]|nr:dammaradiene synthase [Ceratobasidium sp. AG-Ba]